MDVASDEVPPCQFFQNLRVVVRSLRRVVDVPEELWNVLRDSIQTQVEPRREGVKRRFRFDSVDDTDFHVINYLRLKMLTPTVALTWLVMTRTTSFIA